MGVCIVGGVIVGTRRKPDSQLHEDGDRLEMKVAMVAMVAARRQRAPLGAVDAVLRARGSGAHEDLPGETAKIYASAHQDAEPRRETPTYTRQRMRERSTPTRIRLVTHPRNANNTMAPYMSGVLNDCSADKIR